MLRTNGVSLPLFIHFNIGLEEVMMRGYMQKMHLSHYITDLLKGTDRGPSFIYGYVPYCMYTHAKNKHCYRHPNTPLVITSDRKDRERERESVCVLGEVDLRSSVEVLSDRLQGPPEIRSAT